MTKTQANNAARAFINNVTNPDKEWSLATVERQLPLGWQLSASTELGDFFPLTVTNVSTAIMRHKEAQ